jgi:hypothetical protein
MANKAIGTIPRAVLASLLPENVEVRRSVKPGAKYPLYLSTSWGPWAMNTPSAQDAILDNATIYGAEGAPEVVDSIEKKPEESPEVEPETQSEPGFFGGVLDFE